MQSIANHQQSAERMRDVEAPPRPPFARLLLEQGLVTQDQIDLALVEERRTGERFGKILLRWKLLDERQLAVLLARQWQLPFLEEAEIATDTSLFAGLAEWDAQGTGAVPVRCEDGLERVAVAEPTEQRLADVRGRALREPPFCVVTRTTLYRLLAQSADASAAAAPDATEAPHESSSEAERGGFDEIVALLDDESGRLEALRGMVEQFATSVAEHDHAVRQLENELDVTRSAREHDRLTIDRLQREAEERDRLLSLVSGKIAELAAVVQTGRPE